MELQAVWQVCRDIYAQHGVILRLPPNTPPANTYQWRYVQRLADKFAEWRFDDCLAREFIAIAVSYAAERNLLKKGLSIFCQSNMLQLCYDRMQARQEITSGAVDCLRKSLKWVCNQVRPGQTTVQLLLWRSNPQGYPNIVKWYQAQRISELYLALSRTAYRALRTLPPDERSTLPSEARLYMVRGRFLSIPANHAVSQEILGGDLRDGHQSTIGCSPRGRYKLASQAQKR